jgi:DNA-binding transcriptional regulator YiaG
MAAMTRTRPISGPQLARARRRIGISQARLAKAMGRPFQRLSEIELRAAVPDDQARAYIEALRALSTAMVEDLVGQLEASA